MVLKGQGFMLDVFFAVTVVLLMFFSFLSVLSLANKNAGESYKEFVLQKRLLDASEKLVTIELAEYSENTLKHHILSMDNITKIGALGIENIRQLLLLDGYNISLSIRTEDRELLDIGDAVGRTVIKRIALCGGELCVVELRAE
jgi:hypothetical protein